MRESIQQRYGADVANNTRNAFETQVWDIAQQKVKPVIIIWIINYTMNIYATILLLKNNVFMLYLFLMRS